MRNMKGMAVYLKFREKYVWLKKWLKYEEAPVNVRSVHM